MTSFSFKYRNNYLITTINLKNATFNEAIEFKELMDEKIEKGFVNIIVSFPECELMDPTFIGVLVIIWKKVRLKGGSLKLVKSGSFDYSVQHLSGETELFDRYNSLEEALTSNTKPINQLG